MKPKLLLACLLLLLAPLAQYSAQSAPAQPVRTHADLATLQKRIQQISELARPAVVGIRMSGSSGSGCFISDDGWVATAGHVSGTRPGTRCRVVLHGGDMLDAEVYGWNEAWDYGLIKADTKGRKVPFRPLGDSTRLLPGEWLIAMGHPLGPEAGRDAVVRAGRCLTPANDRGLVVMDAPVISGDSGGPVFNLAGEIVAINQSIQTNNVFVNNVTPSVPYRDMLKEFKEKKGFGNANAPQWGRGTRGNDGNLNPAEVRRYQQAVQLLQAKDFAGAAAIFDELVKAPKRPAEVLYNAACAYSQLSGTLKGKAADDAAEKAIQMLSRATEAGWADMNHADQDTDLDPIRNRKEFKAWREAGRRASLRPVVGVTMRFAAGLRVLDVIPNSPADQAGLQVGDIVDRVGTRKIETPAQWAECVIERGISTDEVLQIRRSGRRMEARLAVPSFGARIFGQGGARIMEVDEGGLAFSVGLRPNDVIIRVGDTPVQGALDFANAMMLAPGSEEIILEVRRGFARELIKFSYGTGDTGGGSALPRDDWKQGQKLLALWEKALTRTIAGTVFPLRQKGKQVAFATVVRKDGLLLTKASEVDANEKFDLMDGTTAVPATIVARHDRYDLALVRVARRFEAEVAFKARPAEVPPVGTLLATIDARGRALAQGFVALPQYNSDRTVGEPDPNGPFIGINAKDAEGGGAEITAVTPGQPGDRGGLKVGDVIVKFAGQTVADWPSLMAMIQSRRADETVSIEVRREGAVQTLEVALVPRAQALGQRAPSKGTGKPELGILGSRAKDDGAQIGAVRAGSPAELAGIESGELLLKIDDTAVTDQKSIDAVINARKVGDTVILTLRRDGKEVQIEVELAEQDAPPAPPRAGRPNVKGPINGRHTHFGPVIQHDGVVMPSQQGSPLVDLEGNIIGLNIARADRTRTFALPAARVAEVLAELLARVS